MDNAWFGTSGFNLLMVIISAIGIYISLIVFTRISGLRSFSKMSGFDFGVTIAFGTVLGSTIITNNPPLLQGIVALATLYILQMLVAVYRYRSRAVSNAVDNEPLLLMAGEEMIEENMRTAKVTADDIRAKLREANVINLEEIVAVVMETTGDISVLHVSPNRDKKDFDLSLLQGVRGISRLREKLQAS